MRIVIKTILVLLIIFAGTAAKTLFNLSGNPQLGFVVFLGSLLAAGAVIKYKIDILPRLKSGDSYR